LKPKCDEPPSNFAINFNLRRYNTLNKQPLIAPARLDLSAAEEQTIQQHMPTFLANGFGFCELPAKENKTGGGGGGNAKYGGAMGGGCGAWGGGGCCLALNAVPFSKGWVWRISPATSTNAF
jgi:hypothetical protein